MEKIKHTLGRWIFGTSLEDLKAKQEMMNLAYSQLTKQIVENENQNIADYIRRKYKGLTITDTIGELLAEMQESEREGFCAKAKELQKNEVLQQIISYLVRKQLTYTAMEAVTTEEMNFARATVNGLSLLNEEIDALADYYDEKHARHGEFDKHAVL